MCASADQRADEGLHRLASNRVARLVAFGLEIDTIETKLVFADDPIKTTLKA